MKLFALLPLRFIPSSCVLDVNLSHGLCDPAEDDSSAVSDGVKPAEELKGVLLLGDVLHSKQVNNYINREGEQDRLGEPTELSKRDFLDLGLSAGETIDNHCAPLVGL